MKGAFTTCWLGFLAIGLMLGLPAGNGWAADPEHGEGSKTATETPAAVLKQKIDSGAKLLIIDVRDPGETTTGSIPGAINVPLETLPQRMKDIPKDVQVVFTCNTGRRSSRAAELLQKNGYRASSYCPLRAWKERRYGVETPKAAPPGPLKPGG